MPFWARPEQDRAGRAEISEEDGESGSPMESAAAKGEQAMTTELEPGWCATTNRRCEDIRAEIGRLRAELDELRKIRDGCEKIMLGRKAEIERLRAENAQLREKIEILEAELRVTKRLAEEPSEVTMRRERDEEWK
jgi:chromosome segregation ATPase